MSNQTFVTNDSGVIVERYQVAGAFVYCAVEPFQGSAMDCGYSSINYAQFGQTVGYIRTKQPTPEILAMPRGQARIDAVHAWYNAQAERAYNEIIKAFPEAANGRKDHGDIEITIQQ